MIEDSQPNDVSLFYNTKGWTSVNNGTFLDAFLFEDLRDCSAKYLHLNRKRLSQYLKPTGSYFLDCASGPIQYPEYIEYSRQYNHRVCIDLSIDSLKIAQTQYGSHIIPLHGDIRQLDLSKYIFDCIASIHTLYHLPISDQVPVINKLINALAPSGRIVIIYSNPVCLIEIVKKIILFFLRRKKKPTEFTFQRYTPSEILKVLPGLRLVPYRALSGDDMKRVLPDNCFTKVLLKYLNRIEPRLPLFLSQYYLIIFDKD